MSYKRSRLIFPFFKKKKKSCYMKNKQLAKRAAEGKE